MRISRPPTAAITASALQHEHRAIVARVAADRHTRVLDWGCGHGQMTALLRGAGVPVEAYDYRGPGTGDPAKPLEHFPQITAVYGDDPVRLPYPAGTFSGVLSCGVLEHVQNPEGSLNEIHRVLEPGGILYVFKLPNRFSYLEWVARRAGFAFYHGKAEHDRLYTTATARDLLASHGFKVGELRYANMLPLTFPATPSPALGGMVWAVNRGLARLPVVRFVATNVEAVAVKSSR
jgi:SAM-dependent methyltransferase